MPSNHLILCCSLLLLPPIPPSIRVFSSESVLRIRWPKYWNFSFSISPSNEHPGLISFRMDWLDLLAIQVTLKSLLQHHSSSSWQEKPSSLDYPAAGLFPRSQARGWEGTARTRPDSSVRTGSVWDLHTGGPRQHCADSALGPS